MNHNNAPSAQPESTNRMKNIFEQSLAVLRGDKNRTGNVQKHCVSLPLHIDAANVQKRAVEEAAKALASLWKISDTRRSKLQVPAIQPRIQPNRSGF